MRVRMLLVPLLASAALLAGCTAANPEPSTSQSPSTNGVEALEAEAILDRATDAVNDAESVRVVGEVDAEGTTLAYDLVYVGDDMQGTANIFGVEAELIKIGSDVFIKGDPSLFAAFVPEEQQPLLAALAGKWVKVDASLVTGFVPVPLTAAEWLEPTAEITKGDVTTVDGQQAISIKDADGTELFISLEGEPYPIKMTVDGGEVAFSEWGESVEIEAPDAADVVDIMALLGLG